MRIAISEVRGLWFEIRVNFVLLLPMHFVAGISSQLMAKNQPEVSRSDILVRFPIRVADVLRVTVTLT